MVTRNKTTKSTWNSARTAIYYFVWGKLKWSNYGFKDPKNLLSQEQKELFWWKNSRHMLFFHQKSSFCSWDNKVFGSSSCPLFLPVRHCFRGWSKKNRKVHDMINCLNKNLRTHFVWYLEKEIRCNIENLSIDRVLNKEHFKKLLHCEIFRFMYFCLSLLLLSVSHCFRGL